jgi:hypothetical protein
MPEFQDIRLYWSDRKRYVVFSGYRVPGGGGGSKFTAYITAKKRIAIYDHLDQSLWVYERFSEIIDGRDDESYGGQLMADIAAALGITEWADERLDI